MPASRFDNEKGQSMRKFASIDKSKKGTVDVLIRPILELINSHPDYYTTSSCSGRILALVLPTGRRKDLAFWPYVSHVPADPKEVGTAVFHVNKGDIWLKQEAAIIHIACRDLKSAEVLLESIRSAGWKRAGIIGIHRRFMIEAIGTDAVAIPLGSGGDIRVPKEYIDFAVACCNERMRSNERKLSKLFTALSSTLSDCNTEVTKIDPIV